MVSRRRLWILSGFCFVTIAVMVASFVLPAQYRSEATILVVQQQVPDRYVTPTTTEDLLQALQAMTQDILSRTRLLQIINEFDLYPSDRKHLGPEELVLQMRKNIEIEPMLVNSDRRGANAFKISFVGRTAPTTQAVVNRLTSLFIVENLKTRADQATGTTNFLQEQLTAAQANLQEQEKRLRDFKMQHLGELPQEQQGNLQVLAGLQMQMQNNLAALGRAREQQVYLESLLAQYRSLAPKMTVDPSKPGTGASRVATVEKQLNDLRTQRAALVAHYTPQHPDVVNIDHQIEQTEALLEVLKKNQKNAAAGTDVATAQPGEDDDAAIAQLKSQLKANQVEIANANAEEKQLQARMSEYQHRLNLTPVREQELAELMRNYELSQKNYADLESKRTQSALAASLEQNQQGQQFRIVDAPSYPSRPFFPDRRKLAMIGLAAGLAVGVGLMLLLEMKDSSFHTDKDVSRVLSLPFVIGMPQILSPVEERKRARRRVMEWVSGSLVLATVLVLELFVVWRG